MQSGKNAAESVKESAANVGASARAGMEKTKATAQEKVDKMRAHDPLEKDMASERKEERLHGAELDKQQARAEHAAERQAASKTGAHTGLTTGTGTRAYDPTVGGTDR
ncbi:11 kDa late embryogenesis abundant protein-like [Cucurbita maxima]|uniref:11 kDa late embryogenesis abundant protein-like n=1 Tax=Cucurbita maxima TaxID=3661 RepID=A0A6J1I1X4_CUCMA|nr:11 kDa late embryogenesis abundant protein-like [Cucurbita maxima]